MKKYLMFAALLAVTAASAGQQVTGERKLWYKLTLILDGPPSS